MSHIDRQALHTYDTPYPCIHRQPASLALSHQARTHTFPLTSGFHHSPKPFKKKKKGVSAIFLLSGLSLRVDQLASVAKDLRLNAAIQVRKRVLGWDGVGQSTCVCVQWSQEASVWVKINRAAGGGCVRTTMMDYNNNNA